jgi:hypothetical protein
MLKTFGSHVRGNLVGYIALFVALGGTTYAATGGNFILGQANSASSTTSLTRTGANTGKGLQVTNTSTGAGATALGLNVASGHSPFTVNSGTKVANLNADRLDGFDSTGFIRGRKVDLNLTLGDPETQIATVGPYELRGECFDTGGSGTFLSIYARGPAGLAETVYSQVRNDTTDGGNESQADTLAANGTEVVFFDGTPGGQGYTRFGGTLVLRSSSGAVVQVDFSALTSDAATVCHLWGTATIGT